MKAITGWKVASRHSISSGSFGGAQDSTGAERRWWERAVREWPAPYQALAQMGRLETPADFRRLLNVSGTLPHVSTLNLEIVRWSLLGEFEADVVHDWIAARDAWETGLVRAGLSNDAYPRLILYHALRGNLKRARVLLVTCPLTNCSVIRSVTRRIFRVWW